MPDCGGSFFLGQKPLDHFGFFSDIAEPLFDALGGEREMFVIDTHEVEHGGVEIVHGDFVDGGCIANGFCFTVEVFDMSWLRFDIKGVGGFHLHPVGHFILGLSRVGLSRWTD